MKKHTIRSLQLTKTSSSEKKLNMLTCYDFQTACMLNETALDMILVGDSLGNVILGYETTIEVTLEEMRIFSSAVKRGAKNKFVIADMPFGSYASYDKGIDNGIYLFQNSKCEAVKLEGASELNCKIIKRLTESGVPVMGHIGLMPQSVHAQGGYYKHGKTEDAKKRILNEALALEKAGCFSIVLECVEESLSNEITQALSIPTIGIGSGTQCDGQVLVLNDLLGMSTKTPNFVHPIANLYEVKKELISGYLN
jgi:3-methyl-2-oxobutanoate hydroxymethyltransferase